MSASTPSATAAAAAAANDQPTTSEPRDIQGSNHRILERRLGEEGAASLHSASKVDGNDSSHPLTVFARHKLKPGNEQAFREWVQEITEIQRNHYVGYLGAEIVTPTCCDSNEHVSIFRYDNYDHLQAWMDSPERQSMLEKAQVFVEEPSIMSYHSLEYWFVAAEDEIKKEGRRLGKPPSREKMATVTFLVIWMQSALLGPQVAKIPRLPMWLKTALTVLIIVLLTTYIVMPIVTKYLVRWWLFPDPSKQCYCFTSRESSDEKGEPKDKKIATLSKSTSSGGLSATEKLGQAIQAHEMKLQDEE